MRLNLKMWDSKTRTALFLEGRVVSGPMSEPPYSSGAIKVSQGTLIQ
jgi:hypothetical protein